MTAFKAYFGLAALLLAQGISAAPKPASALTLYAELPLCAVRFRTASTSV
jgi:hypothetical protein